ncbi:MAG: PH domain-containing protein [Methanomassiliicoccaceae archaeon]|jgi:Ca2+/Na+ antiporter|nr:PH domain-containing protein [Methanomassiliicoccaceae archaeon]
MSDDDAYRSKMGAFYAGVIIFLFILGGALLVGGISKFIGGTVLVWLVALFFLYMWLRARYTFKENGLLIRTSISGREIDYSSIKQIQDLSGLLTVHTMPVLFSSDLIHIKYDKHGDIWISPVRKQEFLSKLRARCPFAYS